MLYQELPRIESSPLDGWGRWLAPALIAGAGLTAALLLLVLGQPLVAGLALLVGLAGAGISSLRKPPVELPTHALEVGPDYSLLGSALGLSKEPVALTTGEGSLLLANAAYRERFGAARAPLDLGANDDARQGLQLAQGMAIRDGAGCVAGIETSAGPTRSTSTGVGPASCSAAPEFLPPSSTPRARSLPAIGRSKSAPFRPIQKLSRCS
jgi:two-component system cell cycle sensor histidine kinase/response regulator CckA